MSCLKIDLFKWPQRKKVISRCYVCLKIQANRCVELLTITMNILCPFLTWRRSIFCNYKKLLCYTLFPIIKSFILIYYCCVGLNILIPKTKMCFQFQLFLHLQNLLIWILFEQYAFIWKWPCTMRNIILLTYKQGVWNKKFGVRNFILMLYSYIYFLSNYALKK